MGNHLCCAKPSRTTAAATVIRWNDGGIEKFGEAIKVGELMVDNPQQFVCNFSDLQAGHRIAPLRAEEDLAVGGVYVLFPMQKYLRCVLSSSDMASLNLLAFRCNSAHRKKSCNSRVFPAVGTGHLSEFSSKNGSAERTDQLQTKKSCNSRVFPAVGTGHLSEFSSKNGSAERTDQLQTKLTELNGDEDQTTELGLGLSQQRIRGLKYWKPVLETIKESPRVRKP